MKLSQYAKQQGISYRTALRWFRAGTIKGYQAPTGTIIVTEGETTPARPEQVAIYACVSSPEHREHLERQVVRLADYCAARGYQVAQVAKKVVSGVNDRRPKLLAVLKDTSISGASWSSTKTGSRALGFTTWRRCSKRMGERLRS